MSNNLLKRLDDLCCNLALYVPEEENHKLVLQDIYSAMGEIDSLREMVFNLEIDLENAKKTIAIHQATLPHLIPEIIQPDPQQAYTFTPPSNTASTCEWRWVGTTQAQNEQWAMTDHGWARVG